MLIWVEGIFVWGASRHATKKKVWDLDSSDYNRSLPDTYVLPSTHSISSDNALAWEALLEGRQS